MSTVLLTHANHTFRVSLDRGTSLAIPLDFNALQPHAFGAPRAHTQIYSTENFTGDTRSGGSCNVSTVTLTAHCNGTHTECVGHLVNEPFSVGRLALDPLVVTALVSLTPELTPGALSPTTLPTVGMITARSLSLALARYRELSLRAVVIRTLPNDLTKTLANWDILSPPALSPEAALLLAELRIDHLVVDLPSLDPMHDNGALAAHRAFFGLPAGSRSLSACTRPNATVTELAYVPDELSDGLYALSLQLPAWNTDAVPSRPLIFPVETV